MTKQIVTNKLGNNIEYNPKGKKFRYKVDGEPKSSVTTEIGKRMDKSFLQHWSKKNRDESIKEIMLMDKVPIDKINVFIKKVQERAEGKEEWARNIGTMLHEWIDLYLKKQNPSLQEKEPLKSMVVKWEKWWRAQKFEVVASEIPLYSKKYDKAGCNDVIVTKKKWNGVNAVLDWKTSSDYNLDQAIQVEVYRRFIEETTDFKIQKLAIVNIPKEIDKEVSMFILDIKDNYFKGFKAIQYLNKLEIEFKNKVKNWKKENKINV